MLPAHHATRIFRPLAVREVISRLGSCRPNASANSCWTSSIARSLAGVVLQRTSVASLKRLRFVLQGPPLKGGDYARSKHLSEGTSEALIGRRPGQGGRHGNDRVERRTTRLGSGRTESRRRADGVYAGQDGGHFNLELFSLAEASRRALAPGLAHALIRTRARPDAAGLGCQVHGWRTRRAPNRRRRGPRQRAVWPLHRRHCGQGRGVPADSSECHPAGGPPWAAHDPGATARGPENLPNIIRVI